MMAEKKVVSESQKRASKKYLSQFAELKIRVLPEQRDTLRSGGFLVVNSAERYHTDCMHRCSRLPFSSMTEESFNLPV